jgi:hypothetical protein
VEGGVAAIAEVERKLLKPRDGVVTVAGILFPSRRCTLSLTLSLVIHGGMVLDGLVVV